MKIVFIGNYQSNYVGEIADEVHLTRELQDAGHDVYRINRDEWREYVIEGSPQGKYKIPEGIQPDFVIFCKWPHFYDGTFITAARSKWNCPIVYWTWDFMDYDENWHFFMAKAADLFLTNEGGKIPQLLAKGINARYFPFDAADKIYNQRELQKTRDIAFFGSCIGQGVRKEFLSELAKEFHIVAFGYNHEGWNALGIEGHPPVYGEELVRELSKTKIILGINVNDDCWGYWSNRVGKTLTLGGFLLQRYVPGMELFLRDGVSYFRTVEQAKERIHHFLSYEDHREAVAQKGYIIGRMSFTSQQRVRELIELLRYYKKEDISKSL